MAMLNIFYKESRWREETISFEVVELPLICVFFKSALVSARPAEGTISIVKRLHHIMATRTLQVLELGSSRVRDGVRSVN